jgi:hypothetical protein
MTDNSMVKRYQRGNKRITDNTMAKRYQRGKLEDVIKE